MVKEKVKKGWGKFTNFFKETLPSGLEKTVDWGMGMVGKVTGGLTGALNDTIWESPIGTMMKVGIGLVAAMVIWSFVNPAETSKIVMSTTETVANAASKAAATAPMLL